MPHLFQFSGVRRLSLHFVDIQSTDKRHGGARTATIRCRFADGISVAKLNELKSEFLGRRKRCRVVGGEK